MTSLPNYFGAFMSLIGFRLIAAYIYLQYEPEEYNLQTAIFLFVRNVILYLVTYETMFSMTYRIEPFKSYFHDAKFNPKYPSEKTIWMERKYTMISCVIGTGYDEFFRLLKHFNIVNVYSDFLGDNLYYSLAIMPIMAFLADAHFYWYHRLLHRPPFFKWWHSIHHKSHNPDPWSGLSFHPMESLLYFSSLLLLFCFPGFHIYHYVVMKIFLDISPVWGHLGIGGWSQGSYFHYLHHSKTHYNFGGMHHWDKWMGTFLTLETEPTVKKGYMKSHI